MMEIKALNAADIRRSGAVLTEACHGLAYESGWWHDLNTGEDMHGKRNVPELLCLIHSEISEAMEGHRKGLMDDKLPHRPMLEVELATIFACGESTARDICTYRTRISA